MTDGERILCIRVLDWPFPACLAPAGGRAVAPGPMALAGRPGVAPTDASRLAAVSRAAAERRVAVGMSVAQARALCADLDVRVPDPAGEAEAAAAFLDRLEDLSPVVEAGGPGVAYVEVGSVLPVHGGMAGLTRRVVELLGAWGWPCTAGVAGGRFAALTAAAMTLPGGVRAVPAGRDADFLAPLSVDLLPLCDDERQTLAQVGLQTLGRLGAVDRGALVARFGPEAARWRELARGAPEPPLSGRHRRVPLAASRFFEDPVADLPPLLFALEPALDSLVAAQKALGRGILALSVRLHLEARGPGAAGGGAPWEGSVALAEPALTGRGLLDGLRALLDRAPLAAPVVGADLTVVRDAPLNGQLGLFPGLAREGGGFAGGDAGRFHELLQRLERLTADGRGVGRFRLRDGLLPEEAFELLPFGAKAPEAPPCRAGVTRGRPLLPGTHRAARGLALRVLPEPSGLRVEDRQGSPARVDGASVVEAAGPFRVGAGWWRGRPDDRFYYEALLDDGLLLLVFRQGASWFLQGVFD